MYSLTKQCFYRKDSNQCEKKFKSNTKLINPNYNSETQNNFHPFRKHTKMTLSAQKQSIIKKILEKNQKINILKSIKPKYKQISQDDKKKFTNHFPKGYEKIKIIGKGGISIVWKAIDLQTHHSYAIKQFMKQYYQQTYYKQLTFNQFMFRSMDQPGKNNFIKNYGRMVVKDTKFLIYQQGGQSLSKKMFSLKGQFYNGQRMYFYMISYKIVQSQNYQWLLNPQTIKSLISEIAKALNFLQKYQIIHNDIKPQNILINNQNQIKICDFGSIISWNSQNIGMITPQYMPPQVLLGSISSKIDIWSLGITIIQIFDGVPIWMTYKCRVQKGNSSIIKCGLLAAKAKNYSKIIEKQKKLINKIKQIIENNSEQFNEKSRLLLIDLVSKMLDINVENRLSAKQVLQHPFVTQQNCFQFD